MKKKSIYLFFFQRLLVFIIYCNLLALGETLPSSNNFTYTKLIGPITLTSNQDLKGMHITSETGPCVILNNSFNNYIENNLIGPCKNDKAYSLGVKASGGGSIKIINNRFNDISTAFYLVGVDNKSRISNINFFGNFVSGVRGPLPRGQMVQLNKVSGDDILIACNVSDQSIDGSVYGTEDHINIFASSGSLNSPIRIVNNKIRGGVSLTGGGIIAVDSGFGENIYIYENILVNSGQYAIGVPGGKNIRVSNNFVYGDSNPWTNVGIYVWKRYSNSSCTGVEVSNNRVNYKNKHGKFNSYWNSNTCGQVFGVETNVWNDHELDVTIWGKEFPQCARPLE